MDLAKVVLINFIDKVRVSDSSPYVTVQRLVRYSLETTDQFNKPSIGKASDETVQSTRVLSLTRRHWDIFDRLADEYDVNAAVLFDAVERYQKVKPCGFDQGVEICLDMIWQTFYADNEKASLESDNDADAIALSDKDLSSSSTIH